jgi:hypothetical protein
MLSVIETYGEQFHEIKNKGWGVPGEGAEGAYQEKGTSG